MNKVILIGNLTRDPELRAVGSGISKCSFTVAVTRRYANAQGERQTDFIPVIVWRGQADNCATYLHKGSKVGVCGSLQVRSYEAQDGSKRYVTEVVADEVQFLDSRNQSQGNMQQSQSAPQQTPSPFEDSLPDFTTIDDDELPF